MRVRRLVLSTVVSVVALGGIIGISPANAAKTVVGCTTDQPRTFEPSVNDAAFAKLTLTEEQGCLYLKTTDRYRVKAKFVAARPTCVAENAAKVLHTQLANERLSATVYRSEFWCDVEINLFIQPKPLFYSFHVVREFRQSSDGVSVLSWGQTCSPNIVDCGAPVPL